MLRGRIPIPIISRICAKTGVNRSVPSSKHELQTKMNKLCVSRSKTAYVFQGSLLSFLDPQQRMSVLGITT